MGRALSLKQLPALSHRCTLGALFAGDQRLIFRFSADVLPLFETSSNSIIHRLIEQALERTPRTHATPPAKARKAMEIASQVIDKVADKSVPPEEQQRRKRALIKGPKEFRVIRGNQPTKKG